MNATKLKVAAELMDMMSRQDFAEWYDQVFMPYIETANPKQRTRVLTELAKILPETLNTN